MRQACHSDVALLQDRDIFSADREFFLRQVSPAGMKAAVSALFWKGDFVQCLNFPGDTVQGVLKRSDELKNQEETGLVTELSNRWWLRKAGVEPVASQFSSGPGKLWLVNGDVLDSTKLYSVATTDYLANGDTGYPMLQNAEPEPMIPLPKLETRELTSEIAATLGYGNDQSLLAGDELDRLDRSRQKPQRASQTTFLRWLNSWMNVDTISSPVNSFDTHQQKYPVLSLKLYKLDFAYSIFA
jgi:hypothetical protein